MGVTCAERVLQWTSRSSSLLLAPSTAHSRFTVVRFCSLARRCYCCDLKHYTPTHYNGQGERRKVRQLRLRSGHLRQGEWRQVRQLRLRRRNLREGEWRQVRQLRLRCWNLCQGIDYHQT
uniref:Uncharacterized protein n=1 Tax=Physcomitrium patens TaxID=3218 RepID=A0A2K1IX37_PHYPA|nr:hypothetical protein PHYPA_023647 [Physcomitrium patens]